jgi:hypothetical protein
VRSYFAVPIKNLAAFSKRIIVAFGIFLLIPNFVFGATLAFLPTTGSYQVGSTVSVGVVVSSGSASLNAVSGALSFPSDVLEVTSLSKNQSIISLWVQEPSFSNSAGTVNFEGIVLNPGFSGNGGKIFTINFKVIGEGVAPLSFTGGSVLANDGEGTEILSGRGTAQFSFTPVITPVATAEEVPIPLDSEDVLENPQLLPTVTSDSHPFETWSKSTTGVFNFDITKDIKSVRLLLDDKETSQPVVMYSPPIRSREIKDLEEGISYLHVQYESVDGWSQVLDYKLMIDTSAPSDFTLREISPAVFLLEAKDELSGIAYYTVQVDGGEVTRIENGDNIYTLSQVSPGTHMFLATAYDHAGNSTTTTGEFVVAEPVHIDTTPINEDREVVINSPLLSNGAIFIATATIGVLGLFLIILLATSIFVTRQAVAELKQRVNKEVRQARMIFDKAFILLKTELEVDIKSLEKASTKRKLTKEESKILKRLQNSIDVAEQAINKQVADVSDVSKNLMK